jgi:hypothetical protein
MNNWLVLDLFGGVLFENLSEQDAVTKAKILSKESGEEVWVAKIVYKINE